MDERTVYVEKYAPLIKYLADRLAARLPDHVAKEDLMSSGVLGLIDAVEKFEPDRGILFKTYAEFRIKGAMLDELRSLDWVPRAVRKKASELEKLWRRLEAELGRPPSDEESAEAMGVELAAYHKSLDEISVINMLDLEAFRIEGSGGGRESLDLYEVLQDDNSQDALTVLGQEELRQVLAEAIDALPEKEKLVVTLYYHEELTMREIGQVMGYTESRISQIHTKSVVRLRGKLSRYFEHRGRGVLRPPLVKEPKPGAKRGPKKKVPLDPAVTEGTAPGVRETGAVPEGAAPGVRESDAVRPSADGTGSPEAGIMSPAEVAVAGFAEGETSPDGGSSPDSMASSEGVTSAESMASPEGVTSAESMESPEGVTSAEGVTSSEGGASSLAVTATSAESGDVRPDGFVFAGSAQREAVAERGAPPESEEGGSSPESADGGPSPESAEGGMSVQGGASPDDACSETSSEAGPSVGGAFAGSARGLVSPDADTTASAENGTAAPSDGGTATSSEGGLATAGGGGAAPADRLGPDDSAGGSVSRDAAGGSSRGSGSGTDVPAPADEASAIPVSADSATAAPSISETAGSASVVAENVAGTSGSVLSGLPASSGAAAPGMCREGADGPADGDGAGTGTASAVTAAPAPSVPSAPSLASAVPHPGSVSPAAPSSASRPPASPSPATTSSASRPPAAPSGASAPPVSPARPAVQRPLTVAPSHSPISLVTDADVIVPLPLPSRPAPVPAVTFAPTHSPVSLVTEVSKAPVKPASQPAPDGASAAPSKSPDAADPLAARDPFGPAAVQPAPDDGQRENGGPVEP
jgi:RNA polymerase sigma factor for flagellar operon FliA